MIGEFMTALRGRLKESVRQVQDSTGAGSASDWADYRYRVGVLTGLRRALQDADEIFRTYLKDDEE